MSSAKIELENLEANRQYLLYSPTEIAYVLRGAMQKGCLLTVCIDRADKFFLSALLDVSSAQVILDCASSDILNGQATRAERLICLTSVDHVKVQFDLPAATLIDWEGRPALSCPLPRALLRLQRREFFRLTTPVANPARCELVIDKEGEVEQLNIPVYDISGGGIGLMATEEQSPEFSRGTTFENCLLTLPDEGQVVVNLLVRNTFEITTRSGARYLRVGCEFIRPPGQAVNKIQRYITRIERERNART